MNNVKQEIRRRIDEEKSEKRRKELEERRKSSSKTKKTRVPLDAEKKNLLKNISLVFIFFLAAAGLFYGASISKKSAEAHYFQTLEAAADKYLSSLLKQANQLLTYKTNHFNSILKNDEYIKNFNTPSWQGVLKTELEARIGGQAIVNLISKDYKNDEIIDNPDMGYGILSTLNELKKSDPGKVSGTLKVEVHKANSDSDSDAGKLIFIRKVTLANPETKKEEVVGYIMARLPQLFMNELIKSFKPATGYVEVVQLFSEKSAILIKKGNASLKSLPVTVSKKMPGTEWVFKFWPMAQAPQPPLLQMWIALLFLGLGALAVVGALIHLLLTIKNINNIKRQQYVLVPEKKNTQIAKSKSTSEANAQAEVSDPIYSENAGIVVDEEDDYLRRATDKIFRVYDIRGVVDEYINVEVFTQIAYGIAVEMAEQNQAKIAVACDGRDSSPELVKALIEALLASGIEVIDIGMVSSPVLYFAALTKADGNGVVVTASHNPANYNGMKIMLSGHSYSETKLQKLKEKVLRGERISGKGQLSKVNIMEDYIAKITDNIILARPMNVVIDSGNGVMGKFAPTFFEQLGCKVTALNSDVDGSFPVHDPDPSRPENMAELIEKIAEVKADLGIAFDGDGDRIGLVTSGGGIIWPDRILMLLAKDILSRNDDATILYDVKSTRNLDTFIRELGGKPVMWKSGHSFMKSKLLETGALLAGEMSGHIFIKERWLGFDDALFVALRVLEILSVDLRKSRQVFAELPDSFNTPEILIASEHSVQVIEKLANDLSCFDDAEVITIDGIRVHYSDGWGLVRSSNTTDNLTMRFEADSEEALQRIATTFKEALLAAEPSLIFPF